MAQEEFQEFFFFSKKSNKRIRIPEGETVIGRGTFLNIKDMKVSRSHAIISLHEKKLKIKPMSSNPTFYWNDNKKLQLQKDTWKTLDCGDIISFLPEDFIFTIEGDNTTKRCNGNDVTINSEINQDVSLESNSDEKESKDGQLTCKQVPDEPNDPKSVDVSDSEEFYKIPEMRCDSLKSNNDDLIDEEGVADNITFEAKTPTKDEEPQEQEKTNSNTTLPLADKKRVLPCWMTAVLQQNTSPKKTGGKPKDARTPSKNQKQRSSTAKSQFSPKAKTLADKNSDVESPTQVENRKRTLSERETNANPISDTKRLKILTEDCKDEPVKSNQILKESNNEQNVMDSGGSNIMLDDRKELSIACDKNLGSIAADIDYQKSAKNTVKHGEGSKNKISKDESSQIKKAKDGKNISQCVSSENESIDKLPKCKYGRSCYRKNPAHFKEFSHSDNSDDDKDESSEQTDDRPECPYGTSCYRKNPQHKLEYKHTQHLAGDLPSTRKSARTRKQPKKSVIAGDSDDDADDNDYDYDDSFIDDNMDAESESSSYDDDNCEDEDWSPDELK
ncbi:aprataxin and PNK-like factor isoform X2 [Rhopilema esculentum]|uniref:aprataxin and PNK-like factor isoform X2 n=1 Tax=Rhopilema esculentum TaxID=499914 RepID=UPI0031E0A103